MANIRDVARLAGVSISSVSNLLNNRNHQMSAQTRERIEQVMATTGYRPARAAALPAPQAKIIGLLLPSIVNPSFSALAHAVDGAARAHRYRVLLGNAYRRTGRGRVYRRYVPAWRARHHRGGERHSPDPFCPGRRAGMKIVSYDNPFRAGGHRYPLFDSVSMDNVAAGRAAQHLLERGCRHIVFATEATLTVGRSQKSTVF